MTRLPIRRQAFRRTSTVAFALLLVFSCFLPPVYATQAPDAAPVRIRIGVTSDGITVITPADLANAGVNLAGVDPRTFAMSSMGQAVAIYVTGENDGAFDSADRLYFFGEKFRGPEMDQKYTDERVYWLDIGGAGGPRIANVEAMPLGNPTPPADFATTLHAEESMVWWTLYSLSMDTQDTWFWSRLQLLSSSSVTAALPYTVPYPSSTAGATVRLEEISNAHVWNVNPDHRTTVAVNGTQVLDEAWDGLQVRKVFSAPIPAGVLTHGVNTVSAGTWTQPGTSADDIYVNYWELDYRRLFRAWQERLDFRAEAGGVQEYAVSGWSAPDVIVWDVTDSRQPIRLSAPAAQPGAADLTVRFRVNTVAGNRYWLQGGNAVQTPASIRLRPPTGLRNPAGGADAIIVTSAALRPEAERLAGWHRAHGRRALVVDIQDAYDEFNNGIYHPKAVQAMMTWAVDNWQSPAPAYLTLFGDGHWNFKGYNPGAYPLAPVHIPPYLAWEDPWQGEVPVDARYGDVNGDRLPDIAVGRIAVNTLGEAAAAVDKIVAYDESTRIAGWQRQALFVADNADGAGDFPAVSDEIIAGYTPSDMQVTRIYLPPAPSAGDVAATKAALLSALQAGSFMVQFTGHGQPERWTHEFIFTAPDIPTLTNGPRLPIVLTFNCLDGYFAHAQPGRYSIAELMQRQPGGGSVAAISPSGLGTTDEQQAFRKILLTVMFTENVRDLGRALTIAKQRFAQTYGIHYLTQTMMLFGDPAMQLPGPAPEGPTLYLPLVAR